MTSVNRQLSKERIIKEQMDDHVVSIVRKWVKEGKAPNKVNIREQPEELKIYHQIFDTLILRGECCTGSKRGGWAKNSTKYVCLRSLRREVIIGLTNISQRGILAFGPQA